MIHFKKHLILLTILLTFQLSADITWGATSTLTTSGAFSVFAPKFGVGGTGHATAAWVDSDAGTIEGATLRPSSTNWVSTTQLSEAGNNGDSPEIAVDPNGKATAVWTQGTGAPSYAVQSSILDPLGVATTTWTGTTTISSAATFAFQTPLIGIGSNSKGVSIWRIQPSSGLYRVNAAAYNGSSWLADETIFFENTAANSGSKSLAVDADGNGVALRVRSGALISRPYSQTGSTWGASTNVSSTGVVGTDGTSVGVDSLGNATAVWVETSGNNLIKAATLTFGSGTWTATSTLSLAGQSASAPIIAVNGNGTAFAIWIRNDGSNDIIQVASSTSPGIWSTPFDLSLTGQDAYGHGIAIDPMGNAAAIWTRNNGSNDIVQARYFSSSSGWESTQDLSGAGDSYDASIKMDESGNVYALYDRYSGASSFIEARVSTAPLLTPIVSSVSPMFGSTAGGDIVTISGSNFTGATAVNFGALPATTFSVISGTEISATSPPQGAGTVNITVTTPGEHQQCLSVMSLLTKK